MAIASVGTLGSALSTTANQSTLVLTTGATVTVGQHITLIIAFDNTQTTDGTSSGVSGVTDSAGNTWFKGHEYTNGNGTAQTGASCALWHCRVTTQLNSGGTITATFANSGNTDASAMSAWRWSTAAGARLAIEGTVGGLANDAAAAGSLNVTTSNIGCLRIRAIASESSSTTALTKTAAFTAVLTQAVSGAGTSNTEMGIRGEYLISTSTGQASAPTAGAGAVDHASVYVAFREAALQTLTPSLFTDTDTFFAPTVTIFTAQVQVT